MLPRIHLLDRLLANQIAAGEVIERPASVVKELLENSIDAGATQIDVEIQQGGLRLISVRDNGCGIHQDDLPLAISRHGTSKIARIEDLAAIRSLGFRGEALASIAAVSRFWISSKPAEQAQAWQLQGNGVQAADVQLAPTAHPTGTTIKVQDLFFNTPARRKFMRSEKTEYLQIEEVFKRIALSHLDVGFSLTYEQRLVYRCLPATTLTQQQSRIAKIFGKNFLAQAIFVAMEATGLSLTGWLSEPSLTRSQNDLQYVYLNGRLMRDKVINHALRQAYTESLPAGRYALFVLYLTIDPQWVDVNVHPTKHEVRFQQARLIHDFLVQAVHKALQKKSSTEHYSLDFSSTDEVAVVAEPVAAYSPNDPAAALATTPCSWGRPLVLLQQRWLVSELEHGILLLDAPQAWRSGLVEELLQAFTHTQLVSQPLLFPYAHVASETIVTQLLAQSMVLQSVGIVLDQLAPNTVILRAVPHALLEIEGKKFLRLLIEQLTSSHPSLEVQQIFTAAACATPFTGCANTTQQQNLLAKLHQYLPLQLPRLPPFCLHLSYTELVQRLATAGN